MIVGFQGETGAFSEDAARALCGGTIVTRGFETFEAMLAATATGAIDAAILPIENTIAGPVRAAVRAWERFAMLRQVDSINHPVEQCLVGLHGASIENLVAAFSHPVALAQCAGFFSRNPHVRATQTYDTAGAVRDIVKAGKPEHAAIASAHSAQIYGALVLETNIADVASNQTRFLLLALDSDASS